MTAALDKALPRMPIVKRAFLLGSVMQDVPLWLLSMGGVAYYQWALGWSTEDTFQVMFDTLYFQNPFWIAAHNCLHAPPILFTGLIIVWRSRRNIGSVSRWLFWFLLACLLHTTVDIFTHVDDGPLLFFPFNWSFRFRSAISYWDGRYYGAEFQQFELTLNVIFLIYLLSPMFYRWFHQWIRTNRD